MRVKPLSFLIIGLVLLSHGTISGFSEELPDPETFFGHKPGADFRLIRWGKIFEYFNLLAQESERVIVEELGETTMGNPFILAVISTPENLARVDKYKEIARKLALGKISRKEADQLVEEGKTIALVTCSMHASECGPTQMSPELGYILATDNSLQIKKILNDVIFLLIPCWNPDGNILTTDWYRQNVGTPFETSPMPWLYHYYAGHDNNRDAFMHNLIETRYVNHILYHEWFPQIFMDMHQMGNTDARLFLSPLYEPRHHSLDPLITREIELTGAYMRTILEEKGKIGVMHYANWNHWRMSAIHTCALWHNVTTILFEAAGIPMATPIFQTAHELSGSSSGGLGKQGNNQTINYPSPWPGGWWRLRDIVEYSYWSVIGFLESGSKNREKYLRNMYRMARNSIEKGKNKPPYAYLIPQDQKDPNTVVKMINILIANGVEVHQTEQPFSALDTEYPPGTYVVLMAQAYRPFMKDILGPQFYPDRRQYPGGPPERTFDLTGWTLPFQMGVTAIPVDIPFNARLKLLKHAEPPAGRIDGGGDAFFLDHNVLDSYQAVNRLLKKGIGVGWATETFTSFGEEFPAGTFVVTGSGILCEVQTLAKEFNLQIKSGHSPQKIMRLAPLRLGLYQSWTADMDEGWTRFIFDHWGFPYDTLHNDDIRRGRLYQKYKVIVLTSLSPDRIIHGHEEGTIPELYAGGIEQKGLAALKRFVKRGGTLITLNTSSQLAVEQFELPLRDISLDYDSTEFFCPSAILKVNIDTEHPLGYGMEKTAAVVFYQSPVYDLQKVDKKASFSMDSGSPQIISVARYSDNPFMSGRLIGDYILINKPALVEVNYGRGKIILFGFRPQNRVQPHGTFMLFFNALYYGSAVNPDLIDPKSTRNQTRLSEEEFVN